MKLCTLKNNNNTKYNLKYFFLENYRLSLQVCLQVQVVQIRSRGTDSLEIWTLTYPYIEHIYTFDRFYMKIIFQAQIENVSLSAGHINNSRRQWATDLDNGAPRSPILNPHNSNHAAFVTIADCRLLQSFRLSFFFAIHVCTYSHVLVWNMGVRIAIPKMNQPAHTAVSLGWRQSRCAAGRCRPHPLSPYTALLVCPATEVFFDKTSPSSR